MPLDLLSFAGSTLSFAVAISWNEVAHAALRGLRAASALHAAVAYAVVVTLLAALVVKLAELGRRRLVVSSGYSMSPAPPAAAPGGFRPAGNSGPAAFLAAQL